jgi:hypothetical protein
MLPGLNHTSAAQLAMAAIVIILGATSGFAGQNDRKPTVVVHPRYVPYVPVSPYARTRCGLVRDCHGRELPPLPTTTANDSMT